MVFLVVNHGLITSNQQDEWISGYRVGGFKHEWTMTFHFIKKGCHPKPIDFHSMIFQRGRAQPPTRNSDMRLDDQIISNPPKMDKTIFEKSLSERFLPKKNWEHQ